MKKSVIVLLGILCAGQAFSQGVGPGSVFFNNRYLSGIGAPIVAPIYGPELANPSRVIRGNASTNGGSATYTGLLLTGTGFTAALFGGASGITDENSPNLAFVQSATFRTSAATAGFFIAPTAAQNVPGTEAGQTATFQLRAWDNRGGTVATWAAAINDPTIARGSSALFTPTFPLGGPTLPPTTPPGLQGLQSFNLVVPEPGVIALGVLGLGALLLRRRK
jgi:hypothetical protein